MVDGSNESLYHANEEFDPNLCTGVPLQKSLEIVDVNSSHLPRNPVKIATGIQAWGGASGPMNPIQDFFVSRFHVIDLSSTVLKNPH